MEAIVLAGGLGTRLRAVVADVPKPMAPIGGRPFLELLLGRLAKQGFQHVVLSLGYRADIVVRHFGPEFHGMRLSYAIEAQPLGTGGAVRSAMQYCAGDHAYVFNGDTFLDLDTAPIEAMWKAYREPVIIARQVTDVSRYGRLQTDGVHVVGFEEKGSPGPGIINAGCYALPRSILQHFEPGSAFSLEKDFFYPTVRRSPFRVFVADGYFIDLGVPDDYARAQRELLQFLC